MSGIDTCMSGIDVWMSGIDVWMSGIEVWYRCVVNFSLFFYVCLCSKSGLSRQNSRNLVT